MNKETFNFIRNAVPNKYTDNSIKINGKNPWVAGADEARKQLNDLL